MMNCSIELVPRSVPSLRAQLEAVKARFPNLGTVNLPDLERFELRSWDACGLARPLFERTLPHIRAMDVPLDRLGVWIDRFGQLGLNELIIVRGDPPQAPGRLVHPTTSVQLIEALSRTAPTLRLYAALDPYRGRMRDECDDLAAKLDAGATGFFTQPFFDLRLMDLWCEQVRGAPVYWGLSPVTRAASKRYWETKNNAVFPTSFDLTLAANQAFARKATAWAHARGDGVYFMPIREDPVTYLSGVLDP